MGHFAKVDENDIVVEVIVAEQDIIDSGIFGEPSNWIKTSYNTVGGIHYDSETNVYSTERALRKNFAVVGGKYDRENDAFHTFRPVVAFPQNYALNPNTFQWEFSDLVPPKPEVPPGGNDWWSWGDIRGEWVYDEPNYTPPTE